MSMKIGTNAISSPPMVHQMNGSHDVTRPTIQRGVYQHFKGGKYYVFGIAQRVDSNDYFVMYRPLYGEPVTVLRPYSEFTERVFRDGREQPRFQMIEEVQDCAECDL
jgi:hypothetical protein